MSAKAAAKALHQVAPVIGRYHLVAPIAAGGMASVHLARVEGKAGFSRLVAIKLLHRHLTQDQDFVAMFLDEARFAARVRHPNVVDVYDVETIDGELVIVMQYIEGASLSALMRQSRKQNRALSLGMYLRTMHDALRGLHAAHELTDESGEPLGLVHRDISPQNVLVGVDGVARVTDFGVAKARGRIVSTQGAAVKGKTRYLAPEQIRGEPLDRRVDIFAGGIVLWECLAGRPLFSGATEAETMMAVLQKSIEPPSRYAPTVSIELDRICLTALERERERRFPTAKAFADALEDAMGRQFSKVRDVSEIVEEVHAEDLARLRAAAKRAPDAVAPEYAAGSAESNSGSEVGLPAAATSGEVSADPETRSAVPITSGARAGPKRRRRTGLLLGISGLIAAALGLGYFLGRGPAQEQPKSVAVSAEATSPPMASARPAPVASISEPPAPSASPESSAVVTSPSRPARTTPPKKPAKTPKKPDQPFMPGAL